MLYDPIKFAPNPSIDDKFGFDENGYPGGPSALLRVGITCLKNRIAEDAGFKPDWTEVDSCLAGVVWYYKEGEETYSHIRRNAVNVNALSDFGQGAIWTGFEELKLHLPKTLPGSIRVSKMEDTDDFISDMNAMADMFEQEGF